MTPGQNPEVSKGVCEANILVSDPDCQGIKPL